MKLELKSWVYSNVHDDLSKKKKKKIAGICSRKKFLTYIPITQKNKDVSYFYSGCYFKGFAFSTTVDFA